MAVQNNSFSHDGISIPTTLVKVGGNISSKGSATFALFCSGEREPRWIVKASRNPSFTNPIEREEQILSQLQKHLDSQEYLKHRIPTPCGYVQLGGSRALVISALPGRIMSHWIGKAEFDTALTLAIEWLAQFHSATLVKRMVIDDKWVETWSYHYMNTIGHLELPPANVQITDQIATVQEDVYQYLLRLRGKSIPLTTVHGDFSPHNLLIDRARISGVIDWSEARLEGLPFEDLLHFPIVVLASRRFTGSRNGNSAEMAWRTILSHVDFLTKHIQQYCKMIDVDAELPFAFIPWYFFITGLKDLLPWRANIESCRYWLDLANESLRTPIERF